MSKRKIEPDETEVIEEEEIEGREPKTVSFFSRFKDYDKSYMITLYRKAERNKKIVLREYESYMPSITEIQETYGGGTYNLYVNEVCDGKIGKLIDSCEIHLEGLTGKNDNPSVPVQAVNQDNDFFSERNLQKFAMLKTIFNGASDGGSNMAELMIKISENNNRMFNEMMKAQQESERRTTDIMLKMAEGNKSNLSELMETWSFFNEISGNSKDSSPIDRLIDLAPAVLNGMNFQAPAPKNAPVIKKELPIKSENEVIDNIIAKIPEGIKAGITEENKEEYITKFHAQYKDDITRDDVSKIINRILEKRR